MSEYRVCNIPVVSVTHILDQKDMLLYVTKIIHNINWNHNNSYNLVWYLFIFKNYDTMNDQIFLCLLITDIIKKHLCHLVHQINS